MKIEDFDLSDEDMRILLNLDRWFLNVEEDETDAEDETETEE